MTYPLSTPVSAGQPTAVDHYNNLRLDALYLGQAAADSVGLASLLAKYERGLTLALVPGTTNRIRVAASIAAPVSLMIDGVMCLAVSNVDLAAGSAPSGGAAAWYVFAVHAAGSTTFTLDVNTSSTETTGRRRIGGFYWNGSKIQGGSFYLDNLTAELARLNIAVPVMADGRLTLTTNVPVTTADVDSSAVLYYTPYVGNRISLYSHAFGWYVTTFAELTADLSGLAIGTNHDVFIYNDAGTLKLQLVEWTNYGVRATSIVLQDGVYVKDGSLEYRYLGTIRCHSNGLCRDQMAHRGVWNMYNRILRPLRFTDGTDSWTVTSTSWEGWRSGTSCYVEFVIGLVDEPVCLDVVARVENNTTAFTYIGIGISVWNVNSAQLNKPGYSVTMADAAASYLGYPGVGYHALCLLQSVSAGTGAIYGDAGTAMAMANALGYVWG
jgi:hypothetical protein